MWEMICGGDDQKWLIVGDEVNAFLSVFSDFFGVVF